MLKALKQYKTVYWQLKLWVRLAIPIALVVTVFYVFLTVQYWQASQEKATLRAEASRLSKVALLAGPSSQNLSGELLRQQDFLGEQIEKLNPVRPHVLLEELLAESALSNVEIKSVSFGEQKEIANAETLLTVQPMSVIVQGPWSNLRLFLDGIHDRRPASSIEDIRVSELNAMATIQVQLAFYLEARDKEDTSGKNAKLPAK